MSRLIFASTFLAVCLYGFAASSPLLGAKQCTWGPSFWCSNITNAKGCNAVSHCIKAVWEKQILPNDDDEVCKICKDMVTQARDQLESNQTQEDLMAVFEGSCKLIPLEIVSKECIKLVDDFIPELVETLASQMNPQVVCSVAGLCNSARIDRLLDISKEEKENALQEAQNEQLCNGCFSVTGEMRRKFDAGSYESFLENMLRTCGKLGSFSDSCSTLVFVHFEDIYAHVRDYFYPENVCHVAGTCTYKFHQHKSSSKEASESTSSGIDNIEITPMGNIGRLDNSEKDDVPCQLCEKLVLHLRDIFIANTTEAEFKKVLDGLCKQTGSFSKECLSIADQYYPIIYDFLVKELDPNAICFMAGICPKGVVMNGPIAPLIPIEKHEIAVRVLNKAKKPLISKDEANSYKPVQDKNKPSVQILHPEEAQLPIERLTIELPYSSKGCYFCQQFLHFIQVEISDSHTEENIKTAVENACKKMPHTIDEACETFVESYGNAVIALLVQEIDPSQVCPLLHLCKNETVEIQTLIHTGSNNKPSCPLCLFAVEQLQTMLKNNKTEESIKNALDNLCCHLSSKLKEECIDFVDTYSRELVESLAAELTPSEVCVYLKLCIDEQPDKSMMEVKIDSFHSEKHLRGDRNNFKKPLLPEYMLENTDDAKEGSIDTNVIFDSTYNGKPLIYAHVSKSNVKDSPQCVICEFVMSQLEKELHDKATEEEIKKIVHGICNHMPKSVRKECNTFVDKYADLVIALLAQELTPADVCAALKFCDGKSLLQIVAATAECNICKDVVGVLQQILSNPNVDRTLEHLIEKTCYAIPKKYFNQCIEIMRNDGERIIKILSAAIDPGSVCSEINACSKNDHSYLRMTRNRRETPNLGAKKCSWGPSYWCQNKDQANECHALKHCQDRVWLGEEPKL